MAKRRTRKQKSKAKHHFTFSDTSQSGVRVQWAAGSKSGTSKSSVKRENKKPFRHAPASKTSSENAVYLAKDGNLGTIKKDVIKSTLIASFILGLELVLYWFWL